MHRSIYPEKFYLLIIFIHLGFFFNINFSGLVLVHCTSICFLKVDALMLTTFSIRFLYHINMFFIPYFKNFMKISFTIHENQFVVMKGLVAKILVYLIPNTKTIPNKSQSLCRPYEWNNRILRN